VVRFFVYCLARQAQPEAWANSRASDPQTIRSMMAASGEDCLEIINTRVAADGFRWVENQTWPL
jgi:hypothetical protein